MNDATAAVLALRDLTVSYAVQRGLWHRPVRIRPVAGVTLAVQAGETVGLVGESGCGKSTLARAAVGLVTPAGGSVWIAGRDLTALRGARRRAARRLAQLVFQDPGGALDPRQTIGAAIAEGVAAGGATGEPRTVAQLLGEVGLPFEMGGARPHELSGGERQRVAIARALAAEPCVLVADEPTSALDAPLRARVLNLLRAAQQRRGLGLLLIAHDPHLVARLCQRVAVMYAGHLVEVWRVEALAGPRHPYTRALIAAAPTVAGALRGAAALTPLSGEPASLLDPPSGCPYHPRCEIAEPTCRQGIPALVAVAADHLLRCPPAARGA